MALLTLLDAQLAFGHVPLLDHADFSLETQERVGLIGRNGAGKSSLLKILAGMEKPDDGSLQVQGNTRIAYVAQEPALSSDATVFEATSLGMTRVRALIDEYSQGHGDLDAMQSEIEALDGWNWEQRVNETLHRLHLNPQAVIGTLSGGTKKRVALAQALVAQPDVLLLDEPTNHLDLEMRDALLLSLQEFLGAVVLVSHDRGLLGGVCDEFLRVRDGEVETFDGDLDDYAHWLATTRRGADGVATVSNAEPPALDRKERKRLEAEARNRLAPQRAELKRVERELEVCLAERQTLEARLADPALYASADPAVRALPATHAALLTRIHDLEERWLMLSEELGQ